MLSHATSKQSDGDLAVGGTSLGHLVKYVEFFGLASHAAGAPQDGINALKAANIAMMAMDSQRESFEDKDKVRVHGILTAGGTSVNSIPSIAKLEWRVRGRTIDVVNKINIKILISKLLYAVLSNAQQSLVNVVSLASYNLFPTRTTYFDEL